MSNKVHMMKNERGVALIIVLLVTALLIALVFEFAYSTRVSLSAATNFRDSQRAYFLARSGINYFIKYGKDAQTLAPQGEWIVVPIVSAGDTEVRIKWEDEAGKINIMNIFKGKSPTYDWLVRLFDQVGVSQSVLDTLADPGNPKLQLVTELHKYMTDEEYGKVAPFVTANKFSGDTINTDTASETVLRATQPAERVTDILRKRGEQGQAANSGTLKITSHATVGGYTKQIEVIAKETALDYWKAL